MCSRIEMQGVHYIVKREGIDRRRVHILAPGWCADNNNSFRGIFPYDGNDCVGIRLDIAAPGGTPIWLVADFVKDVWNLLVGRCNVGEEFSGLFLVGLWI